MKTANSVTFEREIWSDSYFSFFDILSKMETCDIAISDK